MPLRRRHLPPSPAPRGYLLLESVVALAVAGVLISLALSFTARQDRALLSLAARRAATRSAESVLISLQSSPLPADPQIKIRRLETPSPAPQRIWIEVTATNSGHSSSLIGLVPASSVAPKEAPHAAP